MQSFDGEHFVLLNFEQTFPFKGMILKYGLQNDGTFSFFCLFY